MLRRLLRTVCTPSGGLILLGGAIGVLAGLERLLSAHPKNQPALRTTANTLPLPKPRSREHYFQVRRTKSELGYVYWYVQGHGRYRCFLLFDTWEEAMNEANTRLSEHGANVSLSALVRT